MTLDSIRNSCDVFSALPHQVVINVLSPDLCAAPTLLTQMIVNIWHNNQCILSPTKALPHRNGSHSWQSCLQQPPHPVPLHYTSSAPEVYKKSLNHRCSLFKSSSETVEGLSEKLLRAPDHRNGVYVEVTTLFLECMEETSTQQ